MSMGPTRSEQAIPSRPYRWVVALVTPALVGSVVFGVNKLGLLKK